MAFQPWTVKYGGLSPPAPPRIFFECVASSVSHVAMPCFSKRKNVSSLFCLVALYVSLHALWSLKGLNDSNKLRLRAALNELRRIRAAGNAAQYEWNEKYEFRNLPVSTKSIRSMDEKTRNRLQTTMKPVCDRVLSSLQQHRAPNCSSPSVQSPPPSVFQSRPPRSPDSRKHVKVKEPVAEGGPPPSSGPCEHLMIVADPDDDAIFGGETLACTALFHPTSCWKVLLLGDGGRKRSLDTTRRDEFVRFSQFMGVEYEMWYHAPGEWLKEVLMERDWKTVMTHNAVGEYGNKFHSSIHRRVLKILPQWLWNRFYVFDPDPRAASNAFEHAPSELKTLGFRFYQSEAAAAVSLFWWVEDARHACLDANGVLLLDKPFKSAGLGIHDYGWNDFRSSFCEREASQCVHAHTHMLWPMT